ncbi:MAG: TonB-dependent hemoglobin/transferrin/lactoferrin family receptor [Rhodocyclales bacterium]|nr:TonB-dependent hemoglobin/transferrin/lactoferrin family receptor [Rhodocyclales bacterium]
MHASPRRRPLAVVIAALSLSLLPHGSGHAQLSQVALKDVVVTATRSEAEITSIPATVTSIDRAALDRRLPADDADLFNDEADVAMARDLRRHGATRVNIRGIEDNRVVQMVDGVRLPDYYNGGGPTNFTMSASPSAMPDFLKRVEIVRGAASSLYGSDAIGGVVGYVTLDPADLLREGAQTGFRLRAGYYGANRGLSQTILGARRGEATELLLGYSHASSKETENQGDVGTTSPSRTEPNRNKTEDSGVLAKLVMRPATGHKLTAMVEARDQGSETDILRLSASLPRVSSMRGDDNSRRVRGSLEWEHVPAAATFYDRLTARIHHQQADTKNYNFQRRSATSAGCSAVTAGANNCYIESDFFFEQQNTGASVQAEKQLKSGDLTHLLAYGADLGRVRVEELRDGRVWNLTTGTFSKALAGETYPLRDFAIGVTDTAGLFVQDEMSGLAAGRLSLTPGLRYDRTRLKPEVDPIAQQVLTLIGRQAVKQEYGSLSPKLGAIWRFDPVLAAYGQLSRGFRAPNYNEVNGTFRNTTQSYGISPNADLKPETSIGAELGLRLNRGKLRGQIAAFDNRYQDFIESIRLSCPADPRCIVGLGTTFMSVNLSRVRIHGAEARAIWDFAPGWSAGGTLALSRGSDQATGRPLNSIEPTRLAASLARDFGAWGVEGRLRGAARKTRVDDTDGVWYHTPGYLVTDLAATWTIERRVRLSLAVNNLLDKKYWLWSDIRQADARNPVGVDFYTQPGRSLSLALQADF